TATSFFFQAEDVIRDFHVTGVQTCALPILASTQVPGTSMQAGYPGCVMSGTSVEVLLLEPRSTSPPLQMVLWPSWLWTVAEPEKIGRASCREGVKTSVDADAVSNRVGYVGA